MNYKRAIKLLLEDPRKKEKRKLIRYCIKHGNLPDKALDKIVNLITEYTEINT